MFAAKTLLVLALATIASGAGGSEPELPNARELVRKLGLPRDTRLQVDKVTKLYKPFSLLVNNDSTIRVYGRVVPDDKLKYFCKSEDLVGSFFPHDKPLEWCKRVTSTESLGWFSTSIMVSYESTCCGDMVCQCNYYNINCECVGPESGISRYTKSMIAQPFGF